MKAHLKRRSARGSVAYLLAFALTLPLAACTKANPNYDPLDGALGDLLDPTPERALLRPDGGPPLDTAADQRQRDSAPPDPDLPQGCTKASDCDDGVPCTSDRCVQGNCVHPLEAGFCSIEGVCYKTGDVDPKNSCQSCDPGKDDDDWTVAGDGSPCASDGLWCTTDRCKAGLCEHDPTLGCAISGVCVAKGQAKPGNGCLVCEPSVDARAYTSVDGKPCGPTSQGLCVANACRRLTASTPPATAMGSDISLAAVAYQPTGKQVWAGGEAVKGGRPGSTGWGVFLRLDAGGAGKLQIAAKPVLAMWDRVAVQGKVFSEFSAGAWGVSSGLAAAMGNRKRHGVWGALIGGKQIYYFSGYASSYSPGMMRCERGAAGWSCANHSGFDKNSTIRAVFGTSSTGIGALWAVPFDGYEHVYANDGSSKSWSRAAPKGCTDAFGAPCHTSFQTNWADLYASSATDVWVVGERGMVMRYDGAAWRRYDAVVQYQPYYDFDVVYSDATSPITIIAGHRDVGYGRYVSLFTYNRALDRWWGPITIEKRFDAPDQETLIRDIGGASATDLWLVGHRSSNNRRRPWAIHLQ
ncbi:MAG: hypothetical protein CSA65_09125 [Proteobacteria bacterium]|nr:MAG: hypothetical protein CSA65_09125 [Pseudomonadota bacterium]